MENTKTAVLTEGDVEGTVTNCQLNEQVTLIERGSAFSFLEKETYTIVNSCTGETVSEYSIPSVSGFGLVSIFAIVVVIIFAILAWSLRY